MVFLFQWQHFHPENNIQVNVNHFQQWLAKINKLKKWSIDHDTCWIAIKGSVRSIHQSDLRVSIGVWRWKSFPSQFMNVGVVKSCHARGWVWALASRHTVVGFVFPGVFVFWPGDLCTTRSEHVKKIIYWWLTISSLISRSSRYAFKIGICEDETMTARFDKIRIRWLLAIVACHACTRSV